MDRDNYTGLVLPLDRSERLMGGFRRRRIRTPAARIPAHITLAHPLPALAGMAEALPRLRALFAREAAFDLSLATVSRFAQAEVLYLEPTPTAPLKRLADAAFAACPGSAPEFPEHVFHLTLTQNLANLDRLDRDIRRRWGAALPLAELVDRAELYAKTSGRWRLQEVFPFGG